MLRRTILRLIVFASTLRLSESVWWPAGSYGIPKPVSGCPRTTGFQWKKGWRSQDTNGASSNNSRSPDFHLDAEVDETKVQRSFCIKTSIIDDHNRPKWPQGQYCIYKRGPCPANFEKGYVYWDDDDSKQNKNKHNGTLPDGTYNENTRIDFCCKSDGEKDTSILLPSESPFFLLAYNSGKCQMVKWAIASVEWIYYDTQNKNNYDGRGGEFPYDAGKKHPKMYYCYYTGCNKTLTSANGTLHSPNYPGKYPNGQYCSWTITVNLTQQILLIFTEFRLQNKINTDELYVYDGKDSKGEVLGVFYGGHPPPEKGMYSSSKHMFIIFKSDKNNSYTGFKASYFGVNISASTGSPDRTTLSEIPSSPADDPNSREKGEPENKGVNVLFVVVPLVLIALLAFVLAGVVFYRKRLQYSV